MGAGLITLLFSGGFNNSANEASIITIDVGNQSETGKLPVKAGRVQAADMGCYTQRNLTGCLVRLIYKTACFLMLVCNATKGNGYLWRMSRHYWIPGIIISLGIGLAVVPIRMTGNDVHSGGLFLAARTFRYTFTAGILSFLLHLWLNRRFLIPNRWRYMGYLMKIVLVAVAVCLISALIDIVFSRLVKNPSFSIAREDLNLFLIVSRALLISALQFFIVLYLHVLSESQRRNLEIEKLERAQLEANLSNLKEQMSPHFLFNTLNTLSAITQDRQVKEYVSEIASVYRYMLIHNKLSLVPLESELSFIKSYLHIIRTRMGSAIVIDINVDERWMQAKIPPLTLQLLLENAIKHNVASVSNPLQIVLYNDGVHLVISNSLNPKKASYLSTGVGLHNLMTRYQLLFSRNITIEKTTAGFTVKLPIINHEDSDHRR